MHIYLIRHGESLANIGVQDPLSDGDAYIGLSDHGKEQAKIVGQTLGYSFIKESMIYCSPYRRTRETIDCILKAANVKKDHELKIYEDPRLREVERGYSDDEAQHPMRLRHGWFYYRHDGGESAADCYDRTSAFLESLMRQVQRRPVENVIIICHGMTIRCFVMRFLHLTVEQFERIANPENCELVVLGPNGSLSQSQFHSGRWEVSGLKFRSLAELSGESI